jgi:tetratricopeptide (TPR) repeat protein
VLKGFTAVRGMDLDSARKNFDEANKINPTQRGLWAGYAAVAEMLGKTSEVKTSMQHELAFHPEEVQLYRPFVQVQLRSGDTTGALATLHAWTKVAPDTPDASVALANQLESMKRHEEALKEAQAAIAHLEPAKVDLTDLRIVAARAQVSLGQAQEAAASVSPLLATVDDPRKVNEIAYLLSEAGTNLREAEQAQAKALAKREQDTMDWTLTDNLRPQFGMESEISAEWDTMGWILFREGKYSEALGYVGAASRGVSQDEIRNHLSAIAAALHRPALAAESDQKLRTVPLGPANGRQGVAGCNLLIVDGKIIDIALTHDESASTHTLEHPEALLKAADLHMLFPPNSKAHLVRTGFVNCHANSCDLVLAPIK